jgi:transcriptional regulator with XRE-family HTH domain
MALIGSRLRELRINRGLTLAQVAEATGFAVSYLSQLERDKVSISVDNLERLSQYYEVHMVHFFRGPEESPVLITRRQQILESLNSSGHGPASVTLLANRPDARMEPLLIKIAPGEEEPHFRKHEADTLLYVLEGRARLISETEEEFVLETGDLIYYVNFPHRRIANASAENFLVMIAITAPPTSSLDEIVQQTKANSR